MGNKRFVIIAVLLLVATFATFAREGKALTLEYSGPEECRPFVISLCGKYLNILGPVKISVKIIDCAATISFEKVEMCTILLSSSIVYDAQINKKRYAFITDLYFDGDIIRLKDEGSYDIIELPDHVLSFLPDKNKTYSEIYKAVAIAFHLVLGIDDE